MTPRQRDTLMFIHRHYGKHGVVPTYDEIMTGIGACSKGNVWAFVKALLDQGWLERTGELKKRRSYMISTKVREMPDEQEWNIAWAKEILEKAGYRVEKL